MALLGPLGRACLRSRSFLDLEFQPALVCRALALWRWAFKGLMSLEEPWQGIIWAHPPAIASELFCGHADELLSHHLTI